MKSYSPVRLPAVFDLAFQLLMLLGSTTRPFRPGEAIDSMRAALGDKYSCNERTWKDRIRAAKDQLVRQGFLKVQDRLWMSTEEGRFQAKLIREIQRP